MRWNPASKAASEGSAGGTTRQSTNSVMAVEQSEGVITGPAALAPHCGCNVLPWEDYEHTANS